MNKVAKIFSYIAFVFAFCFMAIGYAAVQDTLTVNGSVSVEAQNKVFAVYGQILDSNGQPVEKALNFYNRAAVSVGGEITLGEGKQSVEAVYTGFDTGLYENEGQVPWLAEEKVFDAVYVVDVIKPENTRNWFRGDSESKTYFSTCETFDLANLDMSEVANAGFMFADCEYVTSLDLSSFNTSNVEAMDNMFAGCTRLETITVSENFVTTSITENNRDTNMFSNCTALVGGNGTVFDSTKTDSEYARIDGLNGRAGYFTYDGYVLIFDALDGDSSPDAMLSKDKDFNIPSNQPSHTVYETARFLGWGIDDKIYNSGDVYSFVSDSPASATLSAVFDVVTSKDELAAVQGAGVDYTIMPTPNGTSYGSVTADVSGVKVTVDGGKYSSITVTNSDNENIGEVVIKNSAVVTSSFGPIKANDGVTVIIESAEVSLNPNSWGVFTVSGNSTIVVKDGYYARASLFWGGDGTGTVRIEGGTFDVSSFEGMMSGGLPELIISGGKFKINPQDYLAEGCTTVKEGSYWVVTKVCETHSFDASIDNGDGTHSGTCLVCNAVVSEDHDFTNGDCICGAPCTHPELSDGTCPACKYEYIEPVEMPALGEDNADSDELFVDFNNHNPDSDITLYEMNVTSSDSGMYFMKTDADDNYSMMICEAWQDMVSEYPDDAEWLEKIFAGIQELGGNPISLKHWMNIENIRMYENYRIRLVGYDAEADGDLTVEAVFPTPYGEGEPVVVVLSYIEGEYDGTTPVELTHIALRATVNENGKIQFEVPAEQAELMSAGFMMLSVVSQNKD